MLQRHPCAAAAEPVEQDAEEEEVDLTRQLDMGHDKNKGHTEHRQQEADEPDKQYKGRGQPLLSLDEYLDNPPSCRLWPEARQECPQCRKRGRLYCAECLVFVGAPDGVDVPTGLQLPLEVKRVSCVLPCLDSDKEACRETCASDTDIRHVRSSQQTP